MTKFFYIVLPQIRYYEMFSTYKAGKKANIMVMQTIHGNPEAKKYFQLNVKQFHSSNPELCPLLAGRSQRGLSPFFLKIEK